MQKWQCRVAPSLGGGFAGTPNEVWGTKDYENDTDPTCFFGLYGLPDFYALWRHKGEKHILWAGSDIKHFIDGYWLDKKGLIKLDRWALAEWMLYHCESWVENSVERYALDSVGITATEVPSFLGNVDDYQVCFKPGNKLYTSVSGDDFELYGWDKIDGLAKENPHIEFHLYGNNAAWVSSYTNVKVHGRVSQEQMDKETKEMQGALRLTEFDGCSEILVKSWLWGQYPVSTIDYPYTYTPEYMRFILTDSEPSVAREHYINKLNQYPWNINT